MCHNWSLSLFKIDILYDKTYQQTGLIGVACLHQPYARLVSILSRILCIIFSV